MLVIAMTAIAAVQTVIIPMFSEIALWNGVGV